VIRSLEGKAGKPLIRCQINPRDKRKVDVTLTEAGRKAHRAFQDARLAAAVSVVAHLTPKDRSDLMRIFQEIKRIVRNQLSESELQRTN